MALVRTSMASPEDLIQRLSRSQTHRLGTFALSYQDAEVEPLDAAVLDLSVIGSVQEDGKFRLRRLELIRGRARVVERAVPPRASERKPLQLSFVSDDRRSVSDRTASPAEHALPALRDGRQRTQRFGFDPTASRSCGLVDGHNENCQDRSAC